MLKPAIIYKDYIEQNIKEYYYSEDMLLLTASLESWKLNIVEEDEGGTRYQWAICNKEEECIGYLGYNIDWYQSSVFNIVIFSFDRGNPTIGREVFKKFEELINRFHRIEWNAVEGNPAIKSYDRFCKKHKGKKHIFTDTIRDKEGNYRDTYLYEIITNN
jgi:hypothetical protein